MSKPLFSLALAGCAVFSLCNDARATSSVTATLSGLTIETTGTVTEYSSPDSAYPNSEVYVRVNDYTRYFPYYLDDFYKTDYQYRRDDTSYLEGLPLKTITASASSLSAAGTATAKATELTVTASTGVNGGYGFSSASITHLVHLDPYSSITISWMGSFSGSNIGSSPAKYGGDRAAGYISVDMDTLSTPASEGGRNSGGEGFSFERNLPLQTAVFETGATGVDIYYGIAAFVETIDYPDPFNGAPPPPPEPVPEPGTWALLISGLSLAGTFARRRERRH
jgi:hypothetical protein